MRARMCMCMYMWQVGVRQRDESTRGNLARGHLARGHWLVGIGWWAVAGGRALHPLCSSMALSRTADVSRLVAVPWASPSSTEWKDSAPSSTIAEESGTGREMGRPSAPTASASHSSPSAFPLTLQPLEQHRVTSEASAACCSCSGVAHSSSLQHAAADVLLLPGSTSTSVSTTRGSKRPSVNRRYPSGYSPCHASETSAAASGSRCSRPPPSMTPAESTFARER